MTPSPHPAEAQEREAFVGAYLKRDPSASYREMELAWAGVAGAMWQAARASHAPAAASAELSGWVIKSAGDEITLQSPDGERWRYRESTGTGTDSDFVYRFLRSLSAPAAASGEAVAVGMTGQDLTALASAHGANIGFDPAIEFENADQLKNFCVDVLSTQDKASTAAEDPVSREALMQLIADKLSGTFHCIRVWEAWSVGTMSEDDFEDVGESDTPGELADEILALIAPPAKANPAAGAEPWWNDKRQAELNDWFLSLPEGRRRALLDGDRWQLADAAFLAGTNPATNAQAERMLQTAHFFLYGRVFAPPATSERDAEDAARYRLLRDNSHPLGGAFEQSEKRSGESGK